MGELEIIEERFGPVWPEFNFMPDDKRGPELAGHPDIALVETVNNLGGPIVLETYEYADDRLDSARFWSSSRDDSAERVYYDYKEGVPVGCRKVEGGQLDEEVEYLWKALPNNQWQLDVTHARGSRHWRDFMLFDQNLRKLTEIVSDIGTMRFFEYDQTGALTGATEHIGGHSRTTKYEYRDGVVCAAVTIDLAKPRQEVSRSRYLRDEAGRIMLREVDNFYQGVWHSHASRYVYTDQVEPL